MNLAVVIFVIGSAIQCGAVTIPMLFVGTYDMFQSDSLRREARQLLTPHLHANRQSYRGICRWAVDADCAPVYF